MSGNLNDSWTFWASIVASRLSDLQLLSPSSDVKTEDAHHQALDDEIAAMSVALSGLKERRNFFHRKLKFPPEVLEHIFAYAALNEVPGQGRTEAVKALGSVDARAMESKVYEILGWVKLTHVCREWRAIALADGNSWLWSTMDTGRLSKAGMREILNRSHHHPITPKITLSMHPDEIDVFYILLEPGYLSRLKSLQIAADECVHPDNIIRGWDMSGYANDVLCMLTRDNLPAGPMLESLAVAYNDDSNSVFQLPYGLLAPHLRHLMLKDMQLPLDVDIVTYPQLTHFDITFNPRKAAGRDIHIDEFIEFLRGSPNLQVLRLIGSIPKMDHVALADEVNMEVLPVDLMHLEELRLDGTDRDCALFGQYLNIPDSCSITINALPGMIEADPPYYNILESILRRWAHSPVRVDVLSGYPIIRTSMWNISTGANTDGCGESRRTPHTDKPPRLHLRARRFLAAENLIGVYSPQWLWELFPDARTVQRVSVDGNGVVNILISALNPSVSHSAGQQRDQPLFPDLKTLCLRHSNPATLIEDHTLRRCLQARRNVGLATMMDIEFAFSDGTQPSADFEASLAELEGLATFHTSVDQ